MKQMIKNSILNAIDKAGYKLLPKDGFQITEEAFRYDFLQQYKYFERLFDKVKGFEGDIVECGVGAGKSLCILSALCRLEGKNRTVWGYDSFEGFPEPTEEDAGKGHKGHYKVVAKEVRDKLVRFHGDRLFVTNTVSFVKGYFDKTVADHPGKKIALLHADADLYDSYKVVLETLYPKVVTGGVVAFDEYYDGVSQAKYPGAAKAITEFFGERSKDIERDSVTGKYYIAKTEE